MVWALAVACAAILVLLALLAASKRRRNRLEDDLDTADEDLRLSEAEMKDLASKLTTANAELFDSKRREARASQVIRDAEAKIATLQTQGEHLEADYQRTLGQLREAESKASKVDYWKEQADGARADLKRALDGGSPDVKVEPEAKAKAPRNAKDVTAK